jgi:hypothetical protein
MSDWDWDWLLDGSGLRPQDFMPTPKLLPPADGYPSASQVPPSAYGPATLSNELAPDDPVRGQQAQGALNSELTKRGVLGKTYSDIHDALSDWADAAQPIQGKYDTEVNSHIYAMPGGGWQIAPASSNGSHCSDGYRCSTNSMIDTPAPDGGQLWGYIHTHPWNQGLDEANRPDANPSTPVRNAAFVSLPDGRIYGWNAGMQKQPDKLQNFNSPIDQYLMRSVTSPFWR